MKDAKGHGSEKRGGAAHQAGVNGVGMLVHKNVWSGDESSHRVVGRDEVPVWVPHLNHGQENGLWYHGSPTGEPGEGPIHVGTESAAKIALEARIGIPADGYGWHGQEYGKTLLAGQDTLRKMGQISKDFGATGFNAQAPKHDYFPTERKERAVFGGGAPVPFDARPAVRMYELVGKMGKHWIGDEKANSVVKRLKNHGVYYKNEAEDSGSISAVVPNKTWLRKVK